MRRVFIIIFGLLSLGFFIIALLPFAALKSLADFWTVDGNFKSLTPDNASIFRILLAFAALLWLAVAYVIRAGYQNRLRFWVDQYLVDSKNFYKNLISARPDLVSVGAIIFITILAFIIRLFYLNDPMGHDESYTYVVFSSSSLFNVLTNYHLPNNHILNSLLIYFSTHLVGIQPWAVRLPSFLAGVLLVPASYLVARAIYDRYTAFLSAIFISILPGAVYYSVVGRGYSLVMLFTILILGLAQNVCMHKNQFAWSLLVIFSALGFYAIPVMLFPFGAVFAWLFFEKMISGPGEYGSKINFLKYWFVAGISTALLVFIFYSPVFIYSGIEKVFANQFVEPQGWSGYIPALPGFLQNTWRDWTSGMALAWKMLLLAGFLLSLVFHKNITVHRFPLQVAAFLWFVLLLLIQRPENHTKIWAFLQAPFMIWSAAGIMGLLKSLRFKQPGYAPLAAVVTGTALIFAILPSLRALPEIKDRWAEKGAVEEAVLSIKEQLEPRDLIIIDVPFDAAMWYYARLYSLPENVFNQDLPFDRLFVVVSPNYEQTLQSVLQNRGPNMDLINLEDGRLIFNHQYLDTFLVSRRTLQPR